MIERTNKAILSDLSIYLSIPYLATCRSREGLIGWVYNSMTINAFHGETYLYGGIMRERDHFIGFWLNDKEYNHLLEQCEITGLPTSVLIRQALAGVQLRHKPPNEYAALLRELSAIGRNINQIAYWANATRSINESQIVEAAVLAKKAWGLVKTSL